MNRLADFFVSFSVALLLHGLLVLGAVWFWTLRPPELRPVFQGGDVSLAVTFVAAAPDGRQTTDDGRQAADDGPQTADSGRRQPETTDILADPETEMPEDESQVADGRRQTTDDGLRTPDERGQAEEEGEDQDMPDAEPAAPVSEKAPAPVSAGGNLTADSGRQIEENAGRRTPDASLKKAADSSDASRQGVSGAVRMQSEVRPYYPLGARLRGEEGAVTVRVWVKPSGRVSRCEVVRSSGYPVLDEAAADAARRARYVSTQPGTWRAEAETTLTFRFKLTE